MPDSIALPAIALLATGLIALALVWPQGEGTRSPAPFGHPMAALAKPAPSALKSPLGFGAPHAAAPARSPKP